MKINSILAIAALSLVGLTSCEKGFDLNAELVPQEKVDPTLLKAYLTTGDSPYNISTLTLIQTPIGFAEETTAELKVRLSSPAPADVTVEVALETTESDQKAGTVALHKGGGLLPIAPKGVLKLSTNSVVVKKGALQSETSVLVQFDNKDMLRQVDGRYFVASVKVVKTSVGVPSTNFGTSYVAISREEKVLRPFNPNASVDGLTKIEKDRFTTSDLHGVEYYPAENAFDGDNSTYWALDGYRRDGYFQINFNEPVDLAAYRMHLRASSYSLQLQEYELLLSTDGGQTWKSYGRDSFDLRYNDRTGWTHPIQIKEFYGPMKGVTSMRLLKPLAMSPWSYYISIAELELFEKK